MCFWALTTGDPKEEEEEERLVEAAKAINLCLDSQTAMKTTLSTAHKTQLTLGLTERENPEIS